MTNEFKTFNIRLILGIILSALLLAVCLWRVDWDQFSTTFTSIRWGLIPIAISFGVLSGILALHPLDGHYRTFLETLFPLLAGTCDRLFLQYHLSRPDRRSRPHLHHQPGTFDSYHADYIHNDGGSFFRSCDAVILSLFAYHGCRCRSFSRTGRAFRRRGRSRAQSSFFWYLEKD